MWAGLNGYDPRTDLVLGGVRSGMGCMNLVTVISRYTRVPVTLAKVGFAVCLVRSTVCVHGTVKVVSAPLS